MRYIKRLRFKNNWFLIIMMVCCITWVFIFVYAKEPYQKETRNTNSIVETPIPRLASQNISINENEFELNFKDMDKNLLGEYIHSSNAINEVDLIQGKLFIDKSTDKSQGFVKSREALYHQIQSNTYYKLEVLGEYKGVEVDLFIKELDERNRGAVNQYDYYNLENNYYIFKTGKNTKKISWDLYIKGTGNLSIEKIKLSKVNPNEIGMLKLEDKSKITSYYKSANTDIKMDVIKQFAPTIPNPDFMKKANDMVNNNEIEILSYKPVTITNDYDWGSVEDLSHSYLLNSHYFLPDLIASYNETNDPSYINKGYFIIEDWIKKHPIEDRKQSKNSMAWNDDATARRIVNWVQFFDEARLVLPNNKVEYLFEHINETADLLSNPQFYTKNHNHGMFQNTGLLVYSYYFDKVYLSDIYKQIAIARNSEYFNYSYTKDFVHNEHSPSYHMEISGAVKNFSDFLRATKDPTAHYFNDLNNKLAKYAIHYIKPDGFMPKIGDTLGNTKANPSLWENDPEYQFVATKGESGTKPKETNVVFPEGGYAVFRDEWEWDKGTYLFFASAYHNTNHKHNDDLSVWIYHNGDVITEAGSNGYSDDANSIYSKSSFAHNGLIVDNYGLSLEDKKFNQTKILDYNLSDTNNPTVSGITTRYNNISQTRNISYHKKENVIKINDNITSEWNNEYKLLWHLSADIKPVIKGNNVLLYRGDTKVTEVEFSSTTKLKVSEVKGQLKPQIQGWIFNKFYDDNPTPTSVLTVEFEGEDAQVQTTFKLF